MMNTWFVPSGALLTLTHRARCSSVISSPSSFADSEVHHVVGVGGGERERENVTVLSRVLRSLYFFSKQNKSTAARPSEQDDEKEENGQMCSCDVAFPSLESSTT